MDLPFPGMSFSPFDILTAEEMNMMAANDQYLANRPRSQMGVIDVTSTGIKTVSGLGFLPKSVKFFYGRNPSTGFYSDGFGFMTDSIQRAYGGQFRTSGSIEGAISNSTNHCIYAVNQSNAVQIAAQRSSITNGSFAINVTMTGSYTEVWYEAIA